MTRWADSAKQLTGAPSMGKSHKPKWVVALVVASICFAITTVALVFFTIWWAGTDERWNNTAVLTSVITVLLTLSAACAWDAS